MSSTAVSARPSFVERHVERLGLADRAREAVEQEAVLASSVSTRSRITPMITLVGHEVAAVHVLLGLLPSSVSSLTASRRMSPVAM